VRERPARGSPAGKWRLFWRDRERRGPVSRRFTNPLV
jgi:hypothetical protein